MRRSKRSPNSINKCAFHPTFDIDLSGDFDAERLKLAAIIAKQMKATGLQMLSCGTLILQTALAREMTVEEMNIEIAFEASEAGRKYDRLSERLAYAPK